MMPFSFTLPPELNAVAPPERRGLRRDHVRMLVLDRRTGAVEHARFFELGHFLFPGDVLVLNNSRTIPAVLYGETDQEEKVEVRLHRRLGADAWEVLLLSPAAPGVGALAAPGAGAPVRGAWLRFSGGLSALITQRPATPPLRVLHFSHCCRDLTEELYRLGEPVRYEYITQPWGLDYYQTVYASEPGSVEMPSAGRAFTWELLLRLQRQGVGVGYLTLHAGLGYYGDDRFRKEPSASPEEFRIPAATAALVNTARAEGRRVIAVGTTVVRALEYAAAPDGRLSESTGWADLYVGPGYRLRVVDGLLTGFHEPEASHLDMLSAFVAPRLLRAYGDAIRSGYLWHEFGDMNLIAAGAG